MAKLFRRVLVPHDFSEPATRALKVAADLIADLPGRMTVLHVVPPVYTGPGIPPEAVVWAPSPENVRELQTRLEALVMRTLGRRTRGVTCRVVVGHPVEAILDAARRADVIVMATLGRSGLSHLLIGSVAENVVRHAPVPVLTVRAPKGRGAARRAPRARRGR